MIAIDDSAAQTTSYGYDPFGNRTTTAFTDGSYIQVRYDDFGRQTAEMQQTAAGNLAQVRLPNGVIADYQYDDLNRLEFLRHFKDQSGGQAGTYEQNVDILLAEYDLLPDGRRAGVTEKIWLDGGRLSLSGLHVDRRRSRSESSVA